MRQIGWARSDFAVFVVSIRDIDFREIWSVQAILRQTILVSDRPQERLVRRGWAQTSSITNQRDWLIMLRLENLATGVAICYSRLAYCKSYHLLKAEADAYL